MIAILLYTGGIIIVVDIFYVLFFMYYRYVISYVLSPFNKRCDDDDDEFK